MWQGDARVARVARIVCDLSGGSADGLRVLDLGCDQGNFAFKLAELGAAEVVGIEARDQVNDALDRQQRDGVTNARFEQGDVRSVSPETHGVFDVVLCLGILYHLDAPDVFKFVENLAGLTRRFAVIETNVSLSRRRKEWHGGQEYWGKSYPEDISIPASAIDNRESFWPTKPSLLNLLQHAGFTTVAEVHVPVIPMFNAMRDHIVLIAHKGGRQDFEPEEPAAWPERLRAEAHPTQGLRWQIAERINRLRGGGLPRVFGGPDH